jgi:4'-phosphopantetheinyl transferase
MSEVYARPIASPSLTAGQLHVWRARIDPAPADLALLRSTLSPDERDRAARFYFEPDRERYIAARGLLRRLLGQYLQTAPAEVTFRYGPRGKPEVEQPTTAQAVQFNVSHRGSYALYAFVRAREVGVDVEQLRNVSEAMAIARNHFTPAETRLLEQATSASNGRECFFRLWTRKEAVIKAVGTGLSMPLDEFDVSSEWNVEGSWRVVRVPARPDTTWAVLDLWPDVGYRGALCLAGEPVEVSYWSADGFGSR